jgi:hypothetical protein
MMLSLQALNEQFQKLARQIPHPHPLAVQMQN